MTVQSYRDLLVWQKGMHLAVLSYRQTQNLPKQEEYCLTSQIVRAASSIPANIAEGHGRGTRKDYAHFVSIARGSLFELETFVLLVKELQLVEASLCDDLLSVSDEVSRMLASLRARLKDTR